MKPTPPHGDAPPVELHVARESESGVSPTGEPAALGVPARLADVLDQLSEIIVLLRSADGVIVDVSARVAATLGYPREELLGSPIAAFSDTPALGWARLRERVAEAGGHLRLRGGWRHRGGAMIPIALSLSEVTHAGESYLAAVGTLTRSDTLVAESQSLRYETAFARSRDALLFHHPYGAIIDANEAAVELFGRPRPTLVGATPQDLLADPISVAATEEVMSLLLGVGEVRFERRLRGAGGKVFLAEISATRLDFPAGQLIQALIRDVTAERALVERLSQAARIFESLSEGIMVTELDGTIVQVNPAFTRITGYSAEEAVGQNPRILKSGRHDGTFYAAIWRELALRGRWQGEVWNRRKDGSLYPEWLTISTVYDVEGALSHYVSVLSDISHLKQTQTQLDRLAHEDALTGLPNRLRFLQRLDEAIVRAQQQGRAVGLVFVDVDHFKDVNDTLGHAAGDALLRAVATRLAGVLRDRDTVGRLGGDEFVLLLEGVRHVDDAVQIANRALEALRPPVSVDGHELRVTASLGVSVWPDHAEDAETLMKHADLAMYRAKEGGRNAVSRYTPELSERLGERFTLESGLRGAVERGEFRLVWQPQVEFRTGRPLTIEALLRWTHPVVGDVPPGRFIPVAEWIGLIVPLGHWVLHEACAAARRWRNAGLPFERVAINVATRQAATDGFAATVLDVISETGVTPGDLELELTERALGDDVAGDVVEGLAHLREAGVQIAIDDFGTGYSSLSRLKHLPVDVLKIDKGFIDGLPDDGDDRAISMAIIALARALGLAVTAEGIESAVQATAVRALGCDRGQGYFLARPMDEDALIAWLETRRR